MNKKSVGTLFIVPTPIGNLEDISNRAIETLTTVDLILCEDTRKTIKLLNKFNIKKSLISYYSEIEEKASKKALELLLNNKNIALVSDSGTPLISDPGNILIKKCIKNNVNIISLPGPSAFTTALVASGFDLSKFTFYGFLKNTKAELNIIKNSKLVSIIYEAPHRLFQTLEIIKDLIPDRNLCVAKEITKINENYYRGTAEELLRMDILPKGEFIIIIDKNTNVLNIKDFGISLPEHLNHYVNLGLTKNEAIKKVSHDLNIHKNEIYKHFIND